MLSQGAIAGIVFGSIVGLVLLITPNIHEFPGSLRNLLDEKDEDDALAYGDNNWDQDGERDSDTSDEGGLTAVYPVPRPAKSDFLDATIPGVAAAAIGGAAIASSRPRPQRVRHSPPPHSYFTENPTQYNGGAEPLDYGSMQVKGVREMLDGRDRYGY